MFPFVVASACMMSRFSVACRSSGLAFSSKDRTRVPAAGAACLTATGRSRKVTFALVAITTPCSIAVRNSRTFPGQS